MRTDTQQVKLRLSFVDPALAEQLRRMEKGTVLRLFACECASLALTHCGNRDPRLRRAVEVARRYARSLTGNDELGEAYIDAERAADAADQAAFDTQAAFKAGKASPSEYNRAFGVARAAFSAKFCCEKADLKAADDAAYEAWASLRTAVEEGDTLGGLVPPHLSDSAIDSAIMTVLRNILEKLI